MNSHKLTFEQKQQMRDEIMAFRFFIIAFYTLSVISAIASFFAWWLILVSLAFVGLGLTAVHGATHLTKALEDGQ